MIATKIDSGYSERFAATIQEARNLAGKNDIIIDLDTGKKVK